MLGASHRSRWDELTRGSIIGGIIREAGRALDVHVISTSDDGTAERPPLPPIRTRLTPLPRRRQLAGLLLAVIGLPLLTLLLTPFRDDHRLHQRRLLLPHARRGRRDRRRPLARRRRRRRRVRVPQLVLRRAAPHLHDPQRARPGRRGRVPPRRRRSSSTLVDVSARRTAEAPARRSEAEALAGMAGSLLRKGDPDPRAARQPGGPLPARPGRGRSHRTRARGAGGGGHDPRPRRRRDAHAPAHRGRRAARAPAPTCWPPTARCSAPSPPSSRSPSRPGGCRRRRPPPRP